MRMNKLRRRRERAMRAAFDPSYPVSMPSVLPRTKFAWILQITLLMQLSLVALANAQATAADHSLDPHLFLALQDFEARKAIAQREPWAKAALDAILKEANGYPQDYLSKFGLSKVAAPEKTAQWAHWYVCPETGTHLEFHPPDHNICPDTGKDYQDWPISDVHYHYMHDMLSHDAMVLGIAYRMTGKQLYAQHAAEILKLYADKYKDYPIVDNYGKQSNWGARVYSQTLNESIWLIDMTFAYDLVRGSGELSKSDRTHIEQDLLLPSAATVVRGHKEPTNNIQSWINGAQASVGFELDNKMLINEAIDGPLGFRYQMKNYVHEGFWIEGSWGYQFYAMRPLTATAEMAKRHGIDLWKQEPALTSMFDSPLGVMMPDGKLPAFNDSEEVRLYNNSPLYELAYENTHDPVLLTVLDNAPRTSKEALLFGVATLPEAKKSLLKSAVFPESGYAMLRAKNTDLNVILKFGPHGGGHGHYDKLGEIVYAEGRTQAVDPGTQLYGMALHKEWDQMSVAHNTITADELRQDQATGKLVAWKDGENYVAVTASAGPAYSFADLTRSIPVTDDYALQLDHARSTDGKPHIFDFNYHNYGKQTMQLQSEPYSGFAPANGYTHLEQVQRGETSGDIKTSFDNDGTTLSLNMLGGVPTQIFQGVAPGPHPSVKVPFVIVRRKGTDVEFISLLVPSKGDTPAITAKVSKDGAITVQGPSWEDTVILGNVIRYDRHLTPKNR
jgi:oligo-alginate lyase